MVFFYACPQKSLMFDDIYIYGWEDNTYSEIKTIKTTWFQSLLLENCNVVIISISIMVHTFTNY